MARFTKMQQELLLKEMAPLAGEKGQMESLVTQQEAISILFSKMPLGRIALSLVPPEKLKGTPNDLVLENGDRLSVPTPPFVISVVVAVNNHGSVIYEPGKDL